MRRRVRETVGLARVWGQGLPVESSLTVLVCELRVSEHPLQLFETAQVGPNRVAHGLVRTDELPRLVFADDSRRQIVEQSPCFYERRISSVQRFVETLSLFSECIGHAFL